MKFGCLAMCTGREKGRLMERVFWEVDSTPSHPFCFVREAVGGMPPFWLWGAMDDQRSISSTLGVGLLIMMMRDYSMVPMYNHCGGVLSCST